MKRGRDLVPMPKAKKAFLDTVSFAYPSLSSFIFLMRVLMKVYTIIGFSLELFKFGSLSIKIFRVGLI